MAFTGNEGEPIDLKQAATWTRNYRESGANKGADEKIVYAHFYGREVLQRLLAQENCVGIRMYHALDDNNTPQLLLVGVDAEQNDLTEGVIIEGTSPCPPLCDTSGSALTEG